MFYRDHHHPFDAADEPPVPYSERLRAADENPARTLERAHENAPGQVLFEIGLVLAVPLAVAVAIKLLLNLAGISVGV